MVAGSESNMCVLVKIQELSQKVQYFMKLELNTF